MKQKYLYLLLLLGNFALGQDSRLFDNYWYLTNVSQDGTNHTPVVNGTGLQFYNDDTASMTAFGCLNMNASVTFNGEDAFSAFAFQYCLCWCTDPTADAYDQLYFGFFSAGGDETIINNFTYQIIESADEKILVITSEDGKQAFYSNIILARPDISSATFAVFPNPGSDYLLLSGDFTNASIEIRNAVGRLCKTAKIGINEKVDTSGLSSGIYMIKIISGGAVSFKKWIKT